MDLKNLPSRYSQSTDTLRGSQEAADLIREQGPKATTASRPFVIKDIAKTADRPGFINWKSDGHPWFNMEGSAKITGNEVNLEKALLQTQVAAKQGTTVPELPNVKPLLVTTTSEVKDAIEGSKKSKELGQTDETCAWCRPKHLAYMAAVFGVGAAVGWWF